MTSNHIENEETINIEEGEIEVPKLNLSSFSCGKDILLSEGKEDEEEGKEDEGKEDDDEKAEEHHKTTKVARKIEPSTQFGDLKTNHHSTKMTLIESFTDMINKEIVRFANEIHDVYPEVPVDGLLAIWCKQQNLPASTFNLSELELDPYACDTDVDEPAKKAEKKKKKSPKTKQLTPPASDAEDDVPSEDEEPEHGKKKKQPKKEKKEKVADTLKVCLHRFVKGKNANTQCTIKVKGEGDFCSKHKEKKAK